MRYIRLVPVLFFALTLAAAPVKAHAAEVLWENFEGENYWEPVDWENTAQVNLSVGADKASEGKQSLKVVIREEVTDWKNKVGFSREDPIDLSKGNSIAMDIFNEKTADLEVAMGFMTGDGWTYYESDKKPLKSGWNRDITFDLTASDFKNKASDWKYTVSLADRDNVGKVFILLYRPARMSADTVFIDNIRIK
ncbi:MAG: hypothetical protein PHR22_02105 [Candidatus Omnitrophica bacterium]|nr:hypothetical protein [Candidatus Omnitrophota bacterium]